MKEINGVLGGVAGGEEGDGTKGVCWGAGEWLGVKSVM